MQLEVILTGNRIAPRPCKAETTKESKSGNCLCIRIFLSIKLRIIVMTTNLEYRARERQRKRESRRQASEAQRERGRQRSRARDKKQRRHFFVGIFFQQKRRWQWEMPAVTNARWKWAAVRKKWTRKRTTFPQSNVWIRSFSKFHVVVVKNNCKEMYKKSVVHEQSCFFAN